MCSAHIHSRPAQAAPGRCVMKISSDSFHTFLISSNSPPGKRCSQQFKISSASQTPNWRVLINKSNHGQSIARSEESSRRIITGAFRAEAFSWVSSKRGFPGSPPAPGLPNRLRSGGAPAQQKSNKFLIKQPIEKQDEHLFCCSETPVFFRSRKPGLTDHPKGSFAFHNAAKRNIRRLFQSGNLRRLCILLSAAAGALQTGFLLSR